MSALLNMLSAESGLIEADLKRIIVSAPQRYKVFAIAKRSGGFREIAQPAREVKLLQRIIVERVLSALPIHDAAKAYRNGMSVRDNALAHAGHSAILKMDFKEFFPSLKSDDWVSYCGEKKILDKDDQIISSLILFRQNERKKRLQLSIGAPSSPILCNILLFKFDEIVSAGASKRGIHYTRYADDLTFSGQRTGLLRDMPKIVDEACKTIIYPNLVVNKDKTTFITPARRRVVTGVTLSNDGSLSIGWEKKRLISAQVNRALYQRLDLEELVALAGQLAFANVVEPAFIAKLKRKYGNDTILQIQKASRPVSEI